MRFLSSLALVILINGATFLALRDGNPYATNIVYGFAAFDAFAAFLLMLPIKTKDSKPLPKWWNLIVRTLSIARIVSLVAFGWFWCAAANGFVMLAFAVHAERKKGKGVTQKSPL